MTYPPEYVVQRLPSDRAPATREWEEEPWRGLEALELRYSMGDPPAHRPGVRARLAYDEASLWVSFRVEDRYVLATAAKHQDPVCVDSCVELFFTPGPNVGDGYFNIECNCAGTILFHHQLSRGERVRALEIEAIRAMEVRASLPSRVVPETSSPVSWRVSYRVPFEALARHARVEQPRPGVIWRANAYKCADRSSHPHWLTWAPVDLSRPDFHRREYFGILRFA